MTLQVGSQAPDFTGQMHSGEQIRLADYAGKFVVLYFYPKAFTMGCTRETVAFQKNYQAIEALGAQIIGISTDDVTQQCDFAQKHAVQFPLIADSDEKICRAYQAYRSLLSVAKRVTYIINPQGKIAAVFEHELLFNRHITDVLSFLERAKGV